MSLLRFHFALIILALTALCGRGATVDADGHPIEMSSSPAYAFLDITSNTTAYGLGGVNITAIGANANIVDQNPALLGWEHDGQIVVNYMRYIGGSNFAGARFAKSAGERGAWSAAIQYYGYGSIDETTADGAVIGQFSPVDAAFTGTYSHDITDCLRGGATLKFLYSSYGDYTAMAVATDLGINYYDADRDLSASVAVVNLGGQVKRFDQHYDRLPIDVRLGWAKSFGQFPVRFSVTAWNLTRWHLPYYHAKDDGLGYELRQSFGSDLFRHLIFGAELVGSDNFSLALAYNYKTRTDMSTYNRSFLSGFSLSAGLKVRQFGIGLALAQPHTGATTVMLNLSLQLSSLL